MPRQTDFDPQLQERINAFVADISAIVREAALEAVRAALSGEATTAAPARRRAPGRPMGSLNAAAASSKKTDRKKATKSGRRVRRSPEELDQLSDTFMAHVRSNPGQRLEQIGAELGIDTAELKRPVQLLMEAGQLRTEGQRRGTTYFAGRGGARKATKKKTGGKKRAKKAAAKKKATKRKSVKKKAAKRSVVKKTSR